MNQKTEFLVYFILILLAGGLSLLLVTDILQAKAERADLMKTDEILIETAEEEAYEPTPLATAIAIFKDRPDLFSQLVTPKPTATQPILPTPTETPVPLVNEKWKIKNIIGRNVQLTTGDGKTTTYKEGDTVPKDPSAAAYVIVKIDKDGGRIFLWRKTDNVMGWFNKEGGVEYTKEVPK
ncbi:MAG: hypothetical protein AMXMBFR75_17110 [Candidatus Hinthialibacteria bacterium]|nr:hypothetical protein [Candidatus Omnitrophota bacterium]MCK6495165.1 hypothetical protein [bacterium]NUP91359.1 hypothetical protein [Candidatus Omnitrophota bacterium]